MLPHFPLEGKADVNGFLSMTVMDCIRLNSAIRVHQKQPILLACIMSLHAGGGVCIQGGLHPAESASVGGGGVGQTSPGYGQRAGGTHPTGIHSCFTHL